ncbi:MAG: sensor histidine kinase [Patescibacteria group bacterium]
MFRPAYAPQAIDALLKLTGLDSTWAVADRRDDDRILISVADDGVGFDPAKLAAGRSAFGLEVMRERAAQIGGEVRIETAPGRGTTVAVAVAVYQRTDGQIPDGRDPAPAPARNPPSGHCIRPQSGIGQGGRAAGIEGLSRPRRMAKVESQKENAKCAKAGGKSGNQKGDLAEPHQRILGGIADRTPGLSLICRIHRSSLQRRQAILPPGRIHHQSS